MKRFFSLVMTSLVLLLPVMAENVGLVIDTDSPLALYGATKIEAALRRQNIKPVIVNNAASTGKERIELEIVTPNVASEIKPEGFRISQSGNKYKVAAIDQSGAMYGLMDLAEQIELQKGLSNISTRLQNPRFSFRAIKFNLPWSSYRRNPALQLNTEDCKDLEFWEGFLDMMAENRFNVLSLWALHPWPYMIKAENFPEATPFSSDELAEWKALWTSIFRMAKNRGIETYILNWNIFVSESYSQNYGGGRVDEGRDNSSFYIGPAQNSEQIQRYSRESITQVINEYPDLTGLGVTMGEGFQDWNSKQQTDWVKDVFFGGIKDANRTIKFIYRAALKGGHDDHRAAIDGSGLDTPEDPIMVELKFNWSHAHSSTALVKAHGGGSGKEYWTNPAPSHHKMAWMMRNEDFFRLRWGEPDFIREHIQKNGQDYVGGYFIGSETYIPATDIFHKDNHKHVNWDYAYERQWLFYKQWGRLLYEPNTPDAVFGNAFNQKYPGEQGDKMTEAYKLATKTTQRIARSFNWGWDFTFYTEGFMNIRNGFFSVQDVINANPLEPNQLSVKEFGNGSGGGHGSSITPIELASDLERDNLRALFIVNGISTTNDTLKCEIEDVRAWAHLGLYFAKKLRAAVAVNQNNKPDAVTYITEARDHWIDLVEVTDAHIKKGHLMHNKGQFHWKDHLDAVNADIDWVKNH